MIISLPEQPIDIMVGCSLLPLRIFGIGETFLCDFI